jgi:hypothetical protein
MSKPRPGQTRHDIWLPDETRTRLKHMAVERNTTLKQMIEAQMQLMGAAGVDYAELNMQLERTAQLLKEVTKETI